MPSDELRKSGLLWSLKGPGDLKRLTYPQVEELCLQVRELIYQVTTQNGGHLASSLGAVELVVSLLRSFSPPEDRIVFDVGHQAYAYKILTDRRDVFHTLRRKGGIAGFPRRNESPYDAFDVGHSSTSISVALGMAKAKRYGRQRGHVVAVIGDGALLNGLAFEGLNNVTPLKDKVIIVLNDNAMSINHRVGGMAEHLARISANDAYQDLKRRMKGILSETPGGKMVEDALGRWKSKLKSLLLPPNIFEEMDITYWGPFDGHNVEEMDRIFHLAKAYPESLLIHVVTKKGKGYGNVESSPTRFHGVSPKGSSSGSLPARHVPDWSSAVASTIRDMGREDGAVVCATAAMKEGSKLGIFSDEFPHRFFDVGIAESHLLAFAAGMAATGLKPVISIYSTFLQRAMDQLVHDICLPNLPVLLCVDRAGLVGEDGETHQGLLDLCWGRAIPNLTVMSPRDVADLRFMMFEWLSDPRPALLRFPKGTAPDSKRKTAPWGRLEVLQEGRDLCLVGVGSTVQLMEEAGQLLSREGMAPTLVDLRFVKPLDEEAVRKLLGGHRLMVVAEEGYRFGGVGEHIGSLANSIGSPCRVLNLGVSDRFVPHGKRGEQLQEEGLTPEGVVRMIHEIQLG